MSVIHPGSCACVGCRGPTDLRDRPLAVELAEMEARDPKLKAAGERVEAYGRAIAAHQERAEDAVAVVAEAILVLRTRDGVAVTDDQALERARNVVTALIGEGLLKL